jgi:hypothetical protein
MNRRLLFTAGAASLLVPLAGSFAQYAPGQINRTYVVTQHPNVSVTGTINETLLTTIRVPANMVGFAGTIRTTYVFTYTNSANTKTLKMRFSNTKDDMTGFTLWSLLPTTTSLAQCSSMIHNANALNAQQTVNFGSASPFGTAVGSPVSSTVDTTADSYIMMTGQLAVGSENITLSYIIVEVLR